MSGPLTLEGNHPDFCFKDCTSCNPLDNFEGRGGEIVCDSNDNSDYEFTSDSIFDEDNDNNFLQPPNILSNDNNKISSNTDINNISKEAALTTTATTANTTINTTSTTTTIVSDESGFPFSGFEGPEKKLEIELISTSETPASALRIVSPDQWQEILNIVHCKILSITSNEHFDCYVLSESSLFVYPHKFMLKTCGTTTLLRCIPELLKLFKSLALEVVRVVFSRKNFTFPHRQLFPHTSFSDEAAFLSEYFPEGTGYILGPIKKDHWYLFLADYSAKYTQSINVAERNTNVTNCDKCDPPQRKRTHDRGRNVLEIMMHDLDSLRMKYFFKDASFVSSKDTTEKSGINNLLPGGTIDSFMFDPCGYSMNGLLGASYSTIHITPESEFSYVSFETNISPNELHNLGGLTYSQLVSRVLKLFNPRRATLTLFVDGTDRKSADVFDECSNEGYSLSNKTFYEFDAGYTLTMCNLLKTT